MKRGSSRESGRVLVIDDEPVVVDVLRGVLGKRGYRVDAGADALSVINTVMGMAVDINSQKPVLGNRSGGVSGPAIRPIALLKVHQVYQEAGPRGIPIIGQGGIETAHDAIEFLLAGATAVGIGTALFYDPLAAKKVNAGIRDYLAERGLSSVSEIVGNLKTPDSTE